MSAEKVTALGRHGPCGEHMKLNSACASGHSPCIKWRWNQFMAKGATSVQTYFTARQQLHEVLCMFIQAALLQDPSVYVRALRYN
eukprot:1161039-Pelagomonas_calceolata.AAC.2